MAMHWTVAGAAVVGGAFSRGRALSLHCGSLCTCRTHSMGLCSPFDFFFKRVLAILPRLFVRLAWHYCGIRFVTEDRGGAGRGPFALRAGH